MPGETEEFRRRMDVWHPAYQTTEYGGLVFVYMGPPGTEPLSPMYDIIDTRHRDDVVLRGMRLWGDYSVGLVKDLPNGNRFERHAECIIPNAFIIPDIRETGTILKRQERGSELSWAVPVDNEHVTGLSIFAWPLEYDAPKKDWRPGTDTVQDIRPGSTPYQEIRRPSAQ